MEEEYTEDDEGLFVEYSAIQLESWKVGKLKSNRRAGEEEGESPRHCHCPSFIRERMNESRSILLGVICSGAGPGSASCVSSQIWSCLMLASSLLRLSSCLCRIHSFTL